MLATPTGNKHMSDRRNIDAHIAYDDLRDWLSRAELLGEVRHVKGASWQEDIGLAAEAVLRAENGSAPVAGADAEFVSVMDRPCWDSRAP